MEVFSFLEELFELASIRGGPVSILGLVCLYMFGVQVCVWLCLMFVGLCIYMWERMLGLGLK